MIGLCIVLALAFMGLLFSRIHFHFSFNLSISRQAGIDTQRSKSGKVRRVCASPLQSRPKGLAVRSISDPSVTAALKSAADRAEKDLISALVGLGCEKGKALQVAKRAMRQSSDFDSRLKWAVQNAA